MGILSLNDFEDVSIPVPWGHLAGRWYGNRKERPILALHGWQDNLGTFDNLIPQLPDYLGVLCIDFPGHGLSSRLPKGIAYDFADFPVVISRVMQEFKWSKVSLLGHSMGGILSFIYTALAPQTVDLVISIEGVFNPFARLDLETSQFHMDKFEQAEERSEHDEVTIYEKPSYPMQHFCRLLNAATLDALPTEFTPHLLKRGLARSQLYPDKYFNQKDNRTKYYIDFQLSLGLAAEMARCIHQKPYLILKASETDFISERDEEILSILKAQNPELELHEVHGDHYIHLCNAAACAELIVPFLKRHRPPPELQNSPRNHHKL